MFSKINGKNNSKKLTEKFSSNFIDGKWYKHSHHHKNDRNLSSEINNLEKNIKNIDSSVDSISKRFDNINNLKNQFGIINDLDHEYTLKLGNISPIPSNFPSNSSGTYYSLRDFDGIGRKNKNKNNYALKNICAFETSDDYQVDLNIRFSINMRRGTGTHDRSVRTAGDLKLNIINDNGKCKIIDSSDFDKMNFRTYLNFFLAKKGNYFIVYATFDKNNMGDPQNIRSIFEIEIMDPELKSFRKFEKSFQLLLDDNCTGGYFNEYSRNDIREDKIETPCIEEGYNSCADKRETEYLERFNQCEITFINFTSNKAQKIPIKDWDFVYLIQSHSKFTPPEAIAEEAGMINYDVKFRGKNKKYSDAKALNPLGDDEMFKEEHQDKVFETNRREVISYYEN